MTDTQWLLDLVEGATPGPWYRGAIAGIPDAQAHSIVADDANICGLWDGGQTFDSIRANARLITLAPDLARLCVEQHEALVTISRAWDEGRSTAMAEGEPVKRILARFAELKP